MRKIKHNLQKYFMYEILITMQCSILAIFLKIKKTAFDEIY